MPEKYKVGIACIDLGQLITDHEAAADSLQQQIKSLRPANSTLVSMQSVVMRGFVRCICVYSKDTKS